MGCLGDCWDAGPPPDSILSLPPPPLPAFLQPSLSDLLVNTTPCSSNRLCESWTPSANGAPSEGGDYVEMSRKVSSIDDTWLLVLVASSIGVLLLGALLAMFLLKCREMNMFGGNECSLHVRDHHHHRNIKGEPRDCGNSMSTMGSVKLAVHPAENPAIYQGAPVPDNRMVWAALTPRGTQHFISENYPGDLVDYSENEDHYESIDNIQPVLSNAGYGTYSPYQKVPPKDLGPFDACVLADYDYEDPTPLIRPSPRGPSRDYPHYATLENTDMRCASLGGAATLRRAPPPPLIRPRVSSPTQIEHPNLPPLNLHPRNKGMTLKRDAMNFRNGGLAEGQKYAC